MTATIPPERHKAQKAEVEQALRRVLIAPSFRSSAQCQALLRYMVEHSLTQETEMLRERVIGIKVFGRRPDYDSGNDPIVRSRAAEVRKRLAQHYMRGEGASDDLRIEIPPGSYRAVFTTRDSSESYPARHQSVSSNDHHTTPTSLPGEQRDSLRSGTDKSEIGPSGDEIEQSSLSRSRWIRARSTPALAVMASVAVGMGVFGFAAGYFATAHRTDTQREVPALQPAADDPVAAFWAPFIKQDRSPIIAYADAMLLHHP